MDNVRSFLSGVLPAERLTPTAMAPQMRNEAFSQFLDRWAEFREGIPGGRAEQSQQASGDGRSHWVPENSGMAKSVTELIQQAVSAGSQVRSGRPEAIPAESIQGMRGTKQSGLALWQTHPPVAGSSAAGEKDGAGSRGRLEKFHWSRLAASVVTDSLLGSALVIRGDSDSARLLKTNLDRLHALAQELGIPLSGVVVNGDHVVQTVRGNGNGH